MTQREGSEYLLNDYTGIQATDFDTTPQVAFYHAPETREDWTAGIEVVHEADSIETHPKDYSIYGSEYIPLKEKFGRRDREVDIQGATKRPRIWGIPQKWFYGLVVAVIITAIGVGVGVGVGETRPRNSNAESIIQEASGGTTIVTTTMISTTITLSTHTCFNFATTLGSPTNFQKRYYETSTLATLANSFSAATSTPSGTFASTVTITSTVSLTQNTVVPNGLTYYLFPDPYDYSTQDDFDPMRFQSTTANISATGTIQDLSLLSTQYYGLPNQTTNCSLPGPAFLQDCNAVVAVIQGYFYAALEGNYTFRTSADDLGLMWPGASAFNFGGQVPVLNGTYLTPNSTVLSFQAGEVTPVTLLWANFNWIGRFGFSVTTPDGQSYQDTTEFFVKDCGQSGFIY